MVSFKADDRPLVKVIDFGLVKTAGISPGDSVGSTPGTFFGTLRYASPEQIRQGRADIRSDIYSLGITLWEMLIGEAPFHGTSGEVADQHLHAPLPLAKARHLSRPVVSLLCNMLEKDPARRPQTPDEVLAILRAVRTQTTSHGRAVVLARRVAPVFPQDVFTARRTLIFGGSILIALAIIGSYFFWPKFSPSPVDAKSVAVLPFENVSDSKENEYFSDGLTSEVIFQLSKISELRVISRDSILHYKDVPADRHKSLSVIGSELNVRCILDSSVQRVENRVKIVAILYEARTGQRLWGASYDREINELFSIQTDLAEQIAASLHATLSNTERKRIEQTPTENLAAYELYLRGQALLELHQEHTNEMAVELFKQALEGDPKFVLAYTSLADAYVERVSRFNQEKFWLDSAVDLCRQAISLDPSQVRGYTELARAYFWKGWEDRVPDLIAKALELAPNDERANAIALQDSIRNRHFDEAYLLGLKCYSLNPKDPYVPYQMAMLCAMLDARG
jgi:TolB-like protein